MRQITVITGRAEPEEPEPQTCTSEREEALWCQVVLLQYRNDKLTRELAVRDELIGLLKETRATMPSGPTKNALTQKCKYSLCTIQVPLPCYPSQSKDCCGKSHAAKYRWEQRRSLESCQEKR